MKYFLQLIAIITLCISINACQKELTDEVKIPVLDMDAKAFLDSAGIVDTTIKYAVNDLVIQLKDSALWNKFMAVYPMVGGTAASTKWNLKDPRNVDAAYRLSFNGNPVFAATGVLFPTNNDYANTHLNDSLLINVDNSISYYSRTQNTVSGFDMGCHDKAKPYNEMAIYHANDATDYFGFLNSKYKPASTIGLFMISTNPNNILWYENGIQKFEKGGAPSTRNTDYPILIGYAMEASSGGKRECSIATIGKGFSGAEAMTFYNIVDNFNNQLNR